MITVCKYTHKTKVCCDCGDDKPVAAFYENATVRGSKIHIYYTKRCRTCQVAFIKHSRTPEQNLRQKAYMKQYHAARSAV